MFISYSQNFEDIMLWRALQNIENGFYIDVGAAESDFYSVTMAFYERGWTGVNIEPRKTYCNQLNEHRPRDINLCVAAGNKKENRVFYDIDYNGHAHLSTLDMNIAEHHKEQGFLVRTTNVEVDTLANICEEYVKNEIHFLKIDVEGVEKEVLEGFDLKKFRPWIIVIEATFPMLQTVNYSDWEHILLSYEYRFVYFDGLNRFYIAKEHSDLAVHFSTPPNVFDNYKSAYHKKLEDQLNVFDQQTKILNQIKTELEEQINGLNKHIDGLGQQVLAKDGSLLKLQSEILLICNSLSWRMTEPLRHVNLFLKKYIGRLR